MIKVKTAGLLSSIQDLGRFGHKRLGVPVSGAMDQYMARLANKLVGNTSESAVLEMTMVGPVLEFQSDAIIAITGAGFTPTCNNIEISLHTKLVIKAGDVIKFGLASYGLRAYMAVCGGIGNDLVLGSRSQYSGITKHNVLNKGDILTIKTPNEVSRQTTSSVKVNMDHFTVKEIIVFKGPEFELLTKAKQQEIASATLRVNTKSNRMAYLLEGLEHYTAPEIISAPVQPGTVQLTPSGTCVVLMRDAQTTGGYARVLQLSEQGINQLAQKRPGDQFTFRISDLP